MVVGEVARDFPHPVLGDNRTCGEHDFNTFVHQSTDIAGDLVREVGTASHECGVNQVGGLAVVSVYATREAVLEETEVQSGIIGCRGFPLEVFIVGIRAIHQTISSHTHNGITAVLISTVDVVGVEVVVVSDAVLLTSLTPSQTELQLVEPSGILQELLFADEPAESCRREESPVLLEAAGTVVTHCSSEHITVHERVVRTTIEADKVVLLLPLSGRRLVGRSCQRSARLLVGLQAAHGITSFVVGIAPILLVAPFVTAHDIEVVVVIEVFVVLSVGRIDEVVLAFLGIAVIAIIEVGGAPVLIGRVLSAIAPVTGEVHVQAEVFEAMNLVVYFDITHVVKRACTVVFLCQQRHGVLGGIAVCDGGIERVVQ